MTMTVINLLAIEDEPVQGVVAYLKRDDLRVTAAKLEATFYTQEVSDPGPFFLCSSTSTLTKVGAATKRLRSVLGPNRRLVLCMPRTVDAKPLMDMGADKIITPASQEAADIAERVLGQLIDDGTIQNHSFGQLQGATSSMYRLYSEIKALASYDREPVLIRGETGSGKELVAEELHNQSPRATRNLVKVNVAELHPELFGSELFGHKIGAFTGAIGARSGLIGEAEGGTIFLDEIGELKVELQAKLLRVIEDNKIRKVGEDKTTEINVRFVFATNRNLEEACDLGKFKRDLLARIRGFTLEVPPLNRRKADIPLLCHHFLKQFKEKYKDEQKDFRIPPHSLDCLFGYDWPDNVRELRSVLHKAAVYGDYTGELSANVLQESTQGRKSQSPKHTLEFDPWIHKWHEVEKMTLKAYFTAVLVAAEGNRKAAIEMTGLSKAQFYKILKDLGLDL